MPHGPSSPVDDQPLYLRDNDDIAVYIREQFAPLLAEYSFVEVYRKDIPKWYHRLELGYESGSIRLRMGKEHIYFGAEIGPKQAPFTQSISAPGVPEGRRWHYVRSVVNFLYDAPWNWEESRTPSLEEQILEAASLLHKHMDQLIEIFHNPDTVIEFERKYRVYAQREIEKREAQRREESRAKRREQDGAVTGGNGA